MPSQLQGWPGTTWCLTNQVQVIKGHHSLNPHETSWEHHENLLCPAASQGHPHVD